MTKHFAIAAALFLVACGGGSGGEEGDNSSEQTVGAAPIEQTPENLMDDPNNEVVPLTPEANAPVPKADFPSTPVAAIPADFRGRWGMVPNDCIPARPDAKGLVTVTGDTLSFYESRARASDVVRIAPAKITADLAYTGEGQSWRREATLTLLDDGKTLVRDEGQAGAFRYSRCPT